jgi:hypothetical protein
MTRPEFEPGKPATNCLSYGAASLHSSVFPAAQGIDLCASGHASSSPQVKLCLFCFVSFELSSILHVSFLLTVFVLDLFIQINVMPRLITFIRVGFGFISISLFLRSRDFLRNVFA